MLVKIFSANHYDEKCIAVQIVVRMEWLLWNGIEWGLLNCVLCVAWKNNIAVM